MDNFHIPLLSQIGTRPHIQNGQHPDNRMPKNVFIPASYRWKHANHIAISYFCSDKVLLRYAAINHSN